MPAHTMAFWVLIRARCDNPHAAALLKTFCYLSHSPTARKRPFRNTWWRVSAAGPHASGVAVSQFAQRDSDLPEIRISIVLHSAILACCHLQLAGAHWPASHVVMYIPEQWRTDGQPTNSHCTCFALPRTAKTPAEYATGNIQPCLYLALTSHWPRSRFSRSESSLTGS